MPLRTTPFKLLLLCLGLSLLTEARAEIEFTGILVTPQKSTFALADTATGRTGWVATGGDFTGFTVVSYNAKADTLTLTKGETTLRLKLKDDAKVKNARMEITGTITVGRGEKAEVSRAVFAFDQEAVFPLSDGLVLRLTPSLRPDGNILFRSSFERTGPDGTVEKIAAPSVVALPGTQFGIKVGDYGFSFAPK